jgi:DNA processing protein
MPASEERSITSITVESLLGRQLNDIETYYVPSELYVQGVMKIPVPTPRVSIVGSRKASPKGLLETRLMAKKLAEKDVVIVSGLAEGIDTAAHKAAIEAGGKTIAVLGTPLNKTYPHANLALQKEIMRHHLAISQFRIGLPTIPQHFVIRNRTMALISDVTIIIEASDKSGSLHQGWEAIRLGRPLFISKSILNTPGLYKAKSMLEYGAMELNDPEEVLEFLPTSSLEMLDILS